jgi:hypothetical protein
MVILIIILIIFSSPDQVNPQELANQQKGKNNAFLLLKENYSRYKQGEFDQEIILDNSENISLDSGFSGWNLASAFSLNFNDVAIPHFIYSDQENETIFAAQFPFKTENGEGKLNLSDDLIKYLKDRNCFSVRQDGIIYLLRLYENYIGGFAIEKPKRAIILEICSSTPN